MVHSNVFMVQPTTVTGKHPITVVYGIRVLLTISTHLCPFFSLTPVKLPLFGKNTRNLLSCLNFKSETLIETLFCPLTVKSHTKPHDRLLESRPFWICPLGMVFNR